MTDASEDEWEYEYDENETEDFYMTLDMTSFSTVDWEARYANEAEVPEGRLLRPGYAFATKARDGRKLEEDPEEARTVPVGEMQISGLHTKSPLVLFKNGQFVRCQWASSVGTDMLFVKRDPESDLDLEAERPYEPLRMLSEADLLAISATKLVATPVSMSLSDELVEKTHAEKVAGGGDKAGQRAAPKNPGASHFMSRVHTARAKRKDRNETAASSISNRPPSISRLGKDANQSSRGSSSSSNGEGSRHADG